MAAKGQACNVTISGATGSGKTTLAESFVDPCPRVVILDYYQDWEPLHGIATADKAEALDYLLENWDSEKMRLAFRSADTEDCLQIMEFTSQMQQLSSRKSCVLVQEEGWRFSNPQSIPPILHILYTGARRWGMANVALSQRDVNMHGTVRAMSQFTIAFGNMKNSTDIDRIFGARAQQIYTLPPVEYPNAPLENVNYIQTPEGKDVRSWFLGIVL
jgi:hypothetical protein